MKNKLPLIFAIGIMFFNSGFAQSTKLTFDKTVDSINTIIKANKLAYYMPNKQYSGYITKINATEQGIISFTDSIPAPEIIADTDKTVVKKKELISDCCLRKNSRTLDLFSIKEYKIHFPYIYLKDENNETFAKFLGFKKADLEKLAEQFKKLANLCKKEESTTK